MNNPTPKIHSSSYFHVFLFYYFAFTAALHRFGMPLLILLIRFFLGKIFWYTNNTPQLLSNIEFICAVLLIFGFLSRAAVLPLLAILVYLHLNNGGSGEYYYWAIFLVTIFIHGPGILSLDHFFVNRLKLRHYASS